jgi:hypothetical protein
MWGKGRIRIGKCRYRYERMGGSKVERVGTFVGEWGIQSGKGIQICGGMGGSKLESVGTDMG